MGLVGEEGVVHQRGQVQRVRALELRQGCGSGGCKLWVTFVNPARRYEMDSSWQVSMTLQLRLTCQLRASSGMVQVRRTTDGG